MHFSAGGAISTQSFFILSRFLGIHWRSVSPSCVGMTLVVGMALALASSPAAAAAERTFQSFSYGVKKRRIIHINIDVVLEENRCSLLSSRPLVVKSHKH